MAQAQFDRHLKPGDARAALDRISSSQAFKASRFSSSVYEDEPILRTGGQFRRDTEASRAYRLIHQLAQREDLRFAPTAKVFYEQAKMMADFEGHGDPSVAFKSYYPTYQAMSDRQLTSYLSWRAQARKGVIAADTPSFAFVYIYELLMGVGAKPGMEAFDRLMDFWAAWKAGVPDDAGLLDFYMHMWLRDYVVYHGLDASLLGRVGSSLSRQDCVDVYSAVPCLREAEGLVLAGGTLEGDRAQRAFDAMCLASTFRLTGSRFYKEYPAETVRVACGVFSRMVQHCDRRRKVGYVEGLFGPEQRRPHPMFYGAVFYEPEPHPDATYRVNEHEAYVCRGGSWRRRLPCTEEARSRDLGLMLHAVDHEMRRVWEFPKQVRAYEVPRYVEGFVAKEAAAAREAWLAAQTPKVQIDRSLLRGIRSAAVKTRESLLVDEERAEQPVWGAPGTAATGARGSASGSAPGALSGGGAPEPVESALGSRPPTPQAGPFSQLSVAQVAPALVPSAASVSCEPVSAVPAEPAALAPVPCGLTPSELAFLRALLAGDDAAAKTAVGRGMATLMVDAVNEKLFDELGDAVVEFDGDRPALVDDYRPDIEALLG